MSEREDRGLRRLLAASRWHRFCRVLVLTINLFITIRIMKKHYIFIFLICGLLLLIQNVPAQKNRTERILIGEAERITGDRFSYRTRTPAGARVFAVRKPRTNMLRAIDRGLGDLFRLARKHGYKKRLRYSDYTIFIAQPDRIRAGNGGGYSPDIAVSAGQYAGSVYDQGGYIYAAGMVMAFNPCAFIIAEHDRQFNRVANVVRYEGEHLVLYHNDRRLYNRTADHSRGGGHPILN